MPMLIVFAVIVGAALVIAGCEVGRRAVVGRRMEGSIGALRLTPGRSDSMTAGDIDGPRTQPLRARAASRPRVEARPDLAPAARRAS
jgi:hypothetical protein